MSYADLIADVKTAAANPRAVLLRGDENILSDEQRKALESPFDRSAVIAAGAGAGKTRLLVKRAASLVQAGADPARVAVVTFTRKAAKEIETRLRSQFGDRSRLPVCGTVHSLALRRLASQKVEVTLTQDEELGYFVDLLRAELPEEFDEFSDNELMLALNRCREEEKNSTSLGIVAYRFEELLAEEGVVDFTGLVKLASNEVKPWFDYILVDESQDLSSLQKSFLKKLARPNAKFWYIGDGDQSIYAFRGAHGGMMRQLQKECDDTHVLSVNYRSASSIVLHANNVISVNPDRFDIEWKAHRTDEGEVQVDHFDTAADELEAARTWLEASPKTRAVLARTQAVMLPLRELQLPAYTVHESKGLEWPEVWVMGCEASLFPHPLGIKEEERRLFYVAMTRARDMLKMTYCASRSQKRGDSSRKPSGFLFEAQHLQG